MHLKTYINDLKTDDAREDFAGRCGCTLGHLRNVGYGLRDCAPALASAVERESDGAVTRQELCPAEWRAVWPELAAAHG